MEALLAATSVNRVVRQNSNVMTMVRILFILFCSLGALVYAQEPVVRNSQTNTEKRKTGACDFDTFVDQATKLQSYREKRLPSSVAFAAKASEQGTIVIDARSPTAYRECHVAGSVNIPYTDFTSENLARHIPKKQTRILIYCRNNLDDTAVTKISTALPFLEPKTVQQG